MNIIETNLSFNGALTSRARTDTLVLHHAAAATCSAEQVHAWHIGNGWAGIGYHLFIRKDGGIYRGRPIGKVGAHASGSNSTSVGICFKGNYAEETEMPTAQREAGKQAVSYVLAQYPSITRVLRHSDLNATGCPGANFPFDEIAAGSGGAETADKTAAELISGFGPDPAALIYSMSAVSAETDKVKALQIALTLDGKPVTVDGILGSNTAAALNKKILRRGSRGHLVVWVQRLLGAEPDAIFGGITFNKVAVWQRGEHLTADGIVGIKTYRALALDSE